MKRNEKKRDNCVEGESRQRLGGRGPVGRGGGGRGKARSIGSEYKEGGNDRKPVPSSIAVDLHVME
jgi:hypothetical protein